METKWRISILLIFFLSFSLASCSTGGSSGSASSTLNGNVVKQPIEGAEIKIFYYDTNGQEIELTAINAPVITDAFGAYQFEVNISSIADVDGPLILRTVGGMMGAPPAPAPTLEAIVPDPDPLTMANNSISCHLSVASSVAAGLLRKHVQSTGAPPTTDDANAYIALVEDQLAVKLDGDPADPISGIARINDVVDQNLDLFNHPENGMVVHDYIAYLIANFSSESGALDCKMEDQENPGNDTMANFLPFGNGALAALLPDGPSETWTLSLSADKTMLDHGIEDSALLTAKLTNALGLPAADGAEIVFQIVSGTGQLERNRVPTVRGIAKVRFSSSMLCRAVVQASYTIANGNTLSSLLSFMAKNRANPALQVVSPQGDDSGDLTAFDGSLIETLTVSVCEVAESGDCTTVEEFTANRGRGLSRLRLQDDAYHVEWRPSRNLIGEDCEIHFAVADLALGYIDYVPRNENAVPIEFRVDKHPAIRARILHQQGYTAAETTVVLTAEFGLDVYETVHVLSGEQYGVVEVSEALRDIFAEMSETTAEILKSAGYTSVEIGQVLKEVFNEDYLNAASILKVEGFNDEEMMAMLMAVYDRVAAIVNVWVTDIPDLEVPGYTGVSGFNCTEPYIPGLIGSQVIPSDVNYGIGGTYTTVWVAYELVEKTSSTNVLVDIKVSRWPNWFINCPEGWQPANGYSSGIQGALTTQTVSGCLRLGLCVKYAPINATDTYVTNLSLSYTESKETKCPPMCASNAGHWVMQPDAVDIHMGCDDEIFVHLCYNRAEIAPPMPRDIKLTDQDKAELLEKYAPRVWLHGGETFFPSSVEFAFSFMNRQYIKPGEDPNYRWWIVTEEGLDRPSEILPFFYGEWDLTQVPVYAYWREHQVDEPLYDLELCAKLGSLCDWWITPGCMPYPAVQANVVDLVYYVYYPYNLGKILFDTLWGNHVSDWEHLTVRLAKSYDEDKGWLLKPVQIYIAAHDFGGIYPWEHIIKADDFGNADMDGTHPVVYAALGSHGMWKDPGRHCYKDLGPLGDFCDHCNLGYAWDTWKNLETFDYNHERDLAGEGGDWPEWMQTEGVNDPTVGGEDPFSGPIYRWGNPRWDCMDRLGFDYCRLESGPVGPPFKSNWSTLWLD